MHLEGHDHLSDAAIEQLRALTGLHAERTLEYFDRFYAAPLATRLDLAGARVLDCACGDGWLAVALARRGARVVAADLSTAALSRSRAVVQAFGMAELVTVMPADVTSLPFADRAFAAVCTIETIEHVPIAAAMHELVRVCGGLFVIETINRRFPIDTHDTTWPLVHWLPGPLRAAVHARLGADAPNRYPSLAEVEGPLADFVLRTPFKTFADVEAWERMFPFEHPYQGARRIDLTQPKWRAKRAYFRAVFALFGANSRFFLDKIMGVYQRRS